MHTRLGMKATYGPDGYLLLVMALAAIAWAPLFFPGLFQSHGGLLAVYDVVALNRSLQQAQLTPGWAPALSDGGPLPFYLAGAPVLLGVGPAEAVKLVFGLSILTAGLAMYALVRQLWGRRPALLAAMVYTYAPFFLATIYVRGALADALAYALAPVVLWLASDVFVTRWQSLPVARSCLLLTLALAAQTWTQWGLALATLALTVAILLVTHVVQARRESYQALREDRAGARTWIITTLTLAVGTLVGLALWMPIWIAEAGSLLPPTNAAEHVLYPFQLVLPTWGAGISIPGPGDTLPLQIGVVPWAFGVLGLIALVSTREAQPVDEGQPRAYLAFFLLGALVIVALMLPVAAPLWEWLGSMIRYPWQWTGLATLCLAVAAGAVVTAWRKPLTQSGPLAALIVATALASYGYLDMPFVDRDHIPAQHAVNAMLGQDIVLLDYTLAAETLHGSADLPSVQAGDTVHLTLYWQAIRPVSEDYTVFTHIIDAQPKQWAGHDNPPVRGTRPTSSWTVGELVVDEYDLMLDPRTPAGEVEIEAGMYLPADGQRLAARTRSGEDLRVVLGRLLVR